MYCKKRLKGLVALCLSACICTGCGGVKMTEDAQAVQDMIAGLPDIYSVEADEEISSVRTAYDNLSEEEKNTVDITVLNDLEQAKIQVEADEINKKIDEIVISNASYSKLAESKNTVSGIMNMLTDLSAETDNLVNYDKLLKKINDLSDEYTETMLDADNDINSLNNIMTNLNNINSSYSLASSYGYACDIADDASKLSDRLSSVRSELITAASNLKNTCLYGEDYEISLAVIDVIQAIPEDAASVYTPYMNASGFVDDCLEWQQIVQQKIDAQNETMTENHE